MRITTAGGLIRYIDRCCALIRSSSDEQDECLYLLFKDKRSVVL